jgi:hypothetical protein
VNFLNRTLTSIFDVVLWPLDRLGPAWSLIVVSGIFGVLALIAFKHMSPQRSIKAAKDKIKGHLIAIRIYQDDLGIVSSSVGKVLGRNAQYLGLNFGPFVPLAIPFVLVAAQFVVRYAYAPVPVTREPAKVMAGEGTLLEVELVGERAAEVANLEIRLPEGVVAVSPLVRAPSEGRAFLEIVAVQPGVHRIGLALADGSTEEKLLAAGDATLRSMQPRRVNNRDWYRLTEPDHWPALWPAEAGFAKSSPFREIALAYPTRDLGFLPSGEGGILLTFVVASMIVGFLALKPLGVQI